MNRQRRGPTGITAIHLFAGFCALAGVAIIFAMLFAPSKPEAPPTSKAAYEPPPILTNDEPPPLEMMEEDTPVPEPEPVVEGIRLTGLITLTGSETPISGAIVTCVSPSPPPEGDPYADPSAKPPDPMPIPIPIPPAQFAGQSGKSGRYAIAIPGPGSYDVYARNEGYLPAPVQKVVFGPGDIEKQLHISLSRGASISGAVREKETKQPVQGVRIRAYSQDFTGAVRTDADGSYRISGLRTGDYTVALEGEFTSYHRQTLLVKIPGDSAEVTGIDFEVDPAGVVWGYVKDKDGNPVKSPVVLIGDASVVSQFMEAVVQQKAPIAGESDEKGFYRLLGVPFKKEWRVTAHPDKMAPQLSEPFILTSSQRNIRIDLFVLPGTQVTGQVVDTSGNPVPQAEVACIPSYSSVLGPVDAPKALREGKKADDNGMFVIEALPAGEYQILAFHDGFKVTPRGEPIYPDGETNLKGIRVVLTPMNEGEYSIAGVVVDESGAPIAGAEVSLGGVSSNLAVGGQNTRTDNAGAFFIEGVDPGLLVLVCSADGYSPKTVNNIKFDAPMTITLERQSGVNGRVLVRETSQAPSSYSVAAIPRDQSAGMIQQIESMNGRSFNNTDGSFQLSLPPGAYTLQATAPGLTPGSVDVEVGVDSNANGITIYVSQNGGGISGIVRLADGKPADGAMIIASPGDSAAGGVSGFAGVMSRMESAPRANAEGRYEINNLQGGVYAVVARAEGYAPARVGPVTVREGRTTTGTDIRLGKGGALEGTVTMDGQLKPGAIVSVAGPDDAKFATADGRGFYRIEGLGAGEYMASAVALDTIDMYRLFSPLSARVAIAEGQTTVHNFGQERGARVTGFCNPPPESGVMGFAVAMFPGAPEGMAGLNLRNPASWFGGASMSAANYVAGMGTIERDGYFQLMGLPEGSYDMHVYYISLGDMLSGAGRPSAIQPFTVRGQQTLELSIDVAERGD